MTMLNSVTFRCGQEIDQREAGLNILRKYWKAFAPADVHQWGQRITYGGSYIVAAYVDNVIAGILEGLKLDLRGNPANIPTTFQELTAGGTWSTHKAYGDTVVLVDLTIAPEYHGAGLFESFVAFARRNFLSPSGVILTYSPLFFAERRYLIVRKHEYFGAKLIMEIPRSRPGLSMIVAGEEVPAEDVGITAYRVPGLKVNTTNVRSTGEVATSRFSADYYR
jgi:hypothetical protein